MATIPVSKSDVSQMRREGGASFTDGNINKIFQQKLKTSEWENFLGELNEEQRKCITNIVIPSNFRDQDIKLILRQCPFLQELNLIGFSSALTRMAFANIDTPLKLKKIDLMGSYIDDSVIEAILLICPELESLSLLGCDLINGSAFLTINTLTLLKNLVISFTKINDESLSIILSKCTKLEALYCGNCLNITGNAFDRVPELTFLKKFASVGLTPITDEGVSLLLSKCPNLEELDLKGNSLITDKAFERVNSLPFLRKLNLSNTGISDRMVELLLSKCPNLKRRETFFPSDPINMDLFRLIKRC
ncbi:MAG: hypothetical protein JW924_07515 [Fusobacteriaceae bacterium]|nr:hypothetical protein [Fusobacteriaceae bacterium]